MPEFQLSQTYFGEPVEIWILKVCIIPFSMGSITNLEASYKLFDTFWASLACLHKGQFTINFDWGDVC